MRGERKPHGLQVLVRLARARDGASVVEAEDVGAFHAQRQRLEIRGVERLFLVDELLRDDEQVPVDDVVLVEERVMRSRQVGDVELGLGAQEWIVLVLRRVLALQAGRAAADELDPAVLDEGRLGLDVTERARRERAFGAALDERPVK
jgi:hypothetical protein